MDEVQALYEIMSIHLRGASPLWGDNARAGDIVSSRVSRPFVHYFFSGGGHVSHTPSKHHARVILTVKCVADSLAVAQAGKNAISELLRNAGEQDISPRLPNHDVWRVSTVTQDTAIIITEQLDESRFIYHAGNQYVIMMEAK
jgi:hypothetical protein